NPCRGQPVQWLAGSVWQSYSYAQHDNPDMTWKPIGFEGDHKIIVRSKKCTGVGAETLSSESERAIERCSECQSVLYSKALRNCLQRAVESNPNTPWKYLNHEQMSMLIVNERRAKRALQAELAKTRRKLVLSEARTEDWRRLVIFISQNKIKRVSRTLEIMLKRGDSAKVIEDKLHRAIDEMIGPQSGWTDRELALAFLAKAMGGPLFLYALQQAEGYPSESALRRRWPIPELLVSLDIPSATEIRSNITSFLGSRPAPQIPAVGQNLMIDGIALEEVCRYDSSRNAIVGLCREHSADLKKQFDTLEDVEALSQALHVAKTCHHSKDGSVFTIAPITQKDNYFPSPFGLAGSCKGETGKQLAETIQLMIAIYNLHPEGKAKHGPIFTLSTDGESSFRLARFIVCLSETLSPSSELGKVLSQLIGFNLQSGRDGIISTCDPKHIIKRMATLIRSAANIQISDTVITPHHIRTALLSNGLTTDRVDQLLNPVDKQNVPVAVNLLEEISTLDVDEMHELDLTNKIVFKRVQFLGQLFQYFVRPFTDVTMSLSDQIKSLSTYAHLTFALYRKHTTNFMGNALYADSMSVVKCIVWTTARLQLIDPEIQYYLMLVGTDLLEGTFSHVRTLDHARNFDLLQLAHKLSIATEIHSIFQRFPNLYRGHIRRNLEGAKGVDHTNPASWKGETRVGSVILAGASGVWMQGRQSALSLLRSAFKVDEDIINYDQLFSRPGYDILRPFGSVVGLNGEISSQNDPDISAAQSSLPKASTEPIASPAATPDAFVAIDDGPLEIDSFTPDIEPQELNPTKDRAEARSIALGNGKVALKASLVASKLTSDRARKVVIRTLRAQGTTASDLTGRTKRLEAMRQRSEASTIHMVYAGDVGAFLIRSEGRIFLSAAGILNFTLGSSPAVFAIEAEKLNSKDLVVAVQLLNLIFDEETQLWVWDHSYLQHTAPKPSGLLTTTDFSLKVPGAQFYPLAPQLVPALNAPGDDSTETTYGLEAKSLQNVCDTAWLNLKPDSEEILHNIQLLPEYHATPGHLPYSTSTGNFFTIQSAPSFAIIKRDAMEEVQCRLCPFKTELRAMRNHVGTHILWSNRDKVDLRLGNDIKVGIDPCGWCGLDGQCKTQLVTDSKGASKILSTCDYHYAKISQSSAKRVSKSSPCTNIPIHCMICPQGLNHQHPTFWKYNLHHHILEFHASEGPDLTRRYPSLPPQMVVDIYISREEERLLGIPEEDTKDYR
ncbi:hypothetical protein BKA70DRAFT_1074403, partial [Coprinopsis sp. MPI-PUGE-AT-0042]